MDEGCYLADQKAKHDIKNQLKKTHRSGQVKEYLRHLH